MNKKNNKGFTLVELIIAMTIFTVALSIGYKVINGTAKASKNQSQIFNEHQSANLINKYLTKDLEQSVEFTPANTNSNPYRYTLNKSKDPIYYEVLRNTESNQQYYTVTRVVGSSRVDIISKQPTDSKIPFSIRLENGNTRTFKVKLSGIDSNSTKYEFDVASRIVETVTYKDVVSGELKFSFIANEAQSPDKVSYEGKINLLASAFKDNSNEKSESREMNISANTQNGTSEFKLYVEIPINKNDQLIAFIESKGASGVKLGDKNSSFGGSWEIFREQLINNRIEIYDSTGMKITNVKIDNSNINTNEKGEYYFNVINDENEKALIEADVRIIDPTKECSVTIGFGKFN